MTTLDVMFPRKEEPGMQERFTVTWTVDLDAESPLAAAREALRCQRDPYNSATRFKVAFIKERTLHEEGIDLGCDNPLGRPPAVVKGDSVCCGHCGSPHTEFFEDVGRHAPLAVEGGIVFAELMRRQEYEEGDDERIKCIICKMDSELPASFEWR